MWKPSDVVPKYQRRAVALWMLMIFGILAYTFWLFAAAMEKRENPTIYSVHSNTVYTYPDVFVCLYDTYGCETQEMEEMCIASSTTTEGGTTGAVFFPGGEYEHQIPVAGILTKMNGWCLEYKASDVTVFSGEERNSRNSLDYITLKASWYPGGEAGNSTTCVPDGEKWKSHSESVFLYLVDPATNEASSGIQIPYSCVTSESNSHVATNMGIGLRAQHNLDKTTTATYKAASVTSSVHKDEVNGDIIDPYAFVDVKIKQEMNSLEIVTEIDPLDVGEILGSIGGFWDLILILWPIFFVAATRQDPHLKPREFKRSAKTVAKAARLKKITTSLQGPLKRTTGDKGGRQIDDEATKRQIQQPYWETTPPGTHVIDELGV